MAYDKQTFCLQKGAGGQEGAEKLGIPNVSGVFAVLVLGSVGAFVVNIFEGLMDAMRRARKHNVRNIFEYLMFLVISPVNYLFDYLVITVIILNCKI